MALFSFGPAGGIGTLSINGVRLPPRSDGKLWSVDGELNKNPTRLRDYLVIIHQEHRDDFLRLCEILDPE